MGAMLFGVRDAFIFPLSPPPIPELGNATGFDAQLVDTGGIGHEKLVEARNMMPLLPFEEIDLLVIDLKLPGLDGSATLSFSKLLVTAMNLTRMELAPISAATTTVTTSTTATGTVRYVSVQANAPVTSLKYDLTSDVMTPMQVQTQGGVRLTTFKNSATNGAGSLSITDLKVDLTTKTIYADIDGANGVGFKDDYALWKFDTISGPKSFVLQENSLPPANWGDMPSVNLVANYTVSGLFLVNATDIDNIFVKALKLNNVGKSGINAVNNRTISNTAGFGSISLAVAVPEPSTWAMLLAGFALLMLFLGTMMTMFLDFFADQMRVFMG